jgi:hypothetical protein
MNRPTELQTAQGAARDGVYHPPVEPYAGHPSDALDITLRREEPSASIIFWRNFIVVAAIVVVLASLAGAVWP